LFHNSVSFSSSIIFACQLSFFEIFYATTFVFRVQFLLCDDCDVLSHTFLNSHTSLTIAGKTTLLTRLSTGKLSTGLPPTRLSSNETFKINNITFNAMDLGGHEAVRHLWSEYSSGADGIIFMIDATDSRRFLEASEELELLILDLETAAAAAVAANNKHQVSKNNGEDEEGEEEEEEACLWSRAMPIVILLNKYDQENAIVRKDIVKELNLKEIISNWGKDSKNEKKMSSSMPIIEVFCCSVVEDRGYQKAFEWLSQFV
jgi:GTPase SAR1 family protein